MTATERIHVRDVKPYAIPTDLAELTGPTSGVITLPHSVLWAPGDGRVDLDAPGGVALAYRAVLAEGTLEDQARLLNAALLRTVWTQLLLPRRVRDLWENRFPQLRASV